jgi:hypothetical protein
LAKQVNVLFLFKDIKLQWIFQKVLIIVENKKLELYQKMVCYEVHEFEILRCCSKCVEKQKLKEVEFPLEKKKEKEQICIS